MIRAGYGDPYDLPGDEDLMGNAAGRIEPKPLKQRSDKDDLSDHVKIRLWLARQAALQRFLETNQKAA